MKTYWAAFMANEEWAEIKRNTKEQPIVGRLQDQVLAPTDYSGGIGEIT